MTAMRQTEKFYFFRRGDDYEKEFRYSKEEISEFGVPEDEVLNFLKDISFLSVKVNKRRRCMLNNSIKSHGIKLIDILIYQNGYAFLKGDLSNCQIFIKRYYNILLNLPICAFLYEVSLEEIKELARDLTFIDGFRTGTQRSCFEEVLLELSNYSYNSCRKLVDIFLEMDPSEFYKFVNKLKFEQLEDVLDDISEFQKKRAKLLEKIKSSVVEEIDWSEMCDESISYNDNYDL